MALWNYPQERKTLRFFLSKAKGVQRNGKLFDMVRVLLSTWRIVEQRVPALFAVRVQD
jgi:hypothetical protein